MCPVCMATVALIAAGVPATGGLTKRVVKKLRSKAGTATGTPSSNLETLVKGGHHHGSAGNRSAR
jgi:hypothetical protein